MVTRTLPCSVCQRPVTFPVKPGRMGGMFVTEVTHSECRTKKEL